MMRKIRINESQLRKIVAKSVNTILNEMVIDQDMWENPEKYWERIKQNEYEKGPKNWSWIKCQDPVFKRLDLEWIPSEEYDDGIYRDADYHEYYKDGRDLISIEDPEFFEDDFDDDDELYESVIKRAVSESVRKVLKEHDPHSIPGKFCIYNHHIGTHGVSYGLLGPNKEYFVYDPTKLNTIFCTSQKEAAQKADEINRKLDQEESMSRKRFNDMNSMQESRYNRNAVNENLNRHPKIGGGNQQYAKPNQIQADRANFQKYYEELNSKGQVFVTYADEDFDAWLRKEHPELNYHIRLCADWYERTKFYKVGTDPTVGPAQDPRDKNRLKQTRGLKFPDNQ